MIGAFAFSSVQDISGHCVHTLVFIGVIDVTSDIAYDGLNSLRSVNS